MVLEAFQKEILADLSRMHTNSLPPVLESFALCYEQLRSSGQDSEESSVHEERELFLVQLTSRMARELRLLRPQDASRVLSAIGRLGLVDPKLLTTAAALVPPRLAAYSAPEVLALLEAYAAAGNSDTFMLPCLRRALVPLPSALEDRLHELDDAQIVQAASAFASLGHAPGLVALLAVLREPFQRRNASAGQGARRRQAPTTADSTIEQAPRHLAPACQLALATLVAMHLPDSQTWAAAASAVMQGAVKEASKHQDGASLLESLKQSLEFAEDPWRSAAKPSLYSAGELVLACLGFPRHSGRALWYEEVSRKMPEVSLSLLPGFLRHAADAELGETRSAPLPSLPSLRPRRDPEEEGSELSKAKGRAQEVLLERLMQRKGQEELQELPPMVIVALFRSLELINSGPVSLPPEAPEPLKVPWRQVRVATDGFISALSERGY